MYMRLTLGFVGGDWLVVEAENLGDITEIWVLNNKRPLRVIQAIIEVCDRNLGTPVLFVVKLHMLMHSNWAHVFCALKQWDIVFSWLVYSHNT